MDEADSAAADLWLLNTCTVKSPSQSAMDTLLRRGRRLGKALLVAGCVPQVGARSGLAPAGWVTRLRPSLLPGMSVRLHTSQNGSPRLAKPTPGCLTTQGDRRTAELRGLSLLGVTQIDRVVEAVEETLKGHTVQLLAKKALPRLDLPKVGRQRRPGGRLAWLGRQSAGCCVAAAASA